MNKLIWLFFLICTADLSAKKVFNRGNGTEPDSLNIHLAQGVGSHHILRDLYEGLITLDVLGKPTYGMADSYSFNENTLQWVFKLRKTARWSNGKPVIGQHFLNAWNKAIAAETLSPFANLFNNMKKKGDPQKLDVRLPDSHTLIITLQKPDPAFLEKLTLPVFMPLFELTRIDVEKPSRLVVNGGYSLIDWNPQEKITLKKNPYHYDHENIYFDKVVYWVTENQSSELKRFRSGELDMTESIPDNYISWLEKEFPDDLHIYPYQGVFFLGLNNQRPPFDNSLFRQALSVAIDRNILVEKVLKSGQKPAVHLVPPVMYDNVFFSLEPGYQAKKEVAQSLLEQSGVNTFDLEIELLYNNSENQRKVALAVAAMWRQNLGIRTRLRNQEWKVFVSSRKSSERQVFRSGWIADYNDPVNFLELLHSQSLFNFYHYKNSRYDRLVDDLRFVTDTGKRKHLIAEAENILRKDMPIIPLYFYVSRHLVAKNIGGYRDNISDRHLSRYFYYNEK